MLLDPAQGRLVSAVESLISPNPEPSQHLPQVLHHHVTHASHSKNAITLTYFSSVPMPYVC
jgi:hypothetical protein